MMGVGMVNAQFQELTPWFIPIPLLFDHPPELFIPISGGPFVFMFAL